MNKANAKLTAPNLTPKDILEMFEAAKAQIKDWTVVSNVNVSLSKGAAWNVLYPSRNSITQRHLDHAYIPAVNMIREFGEFLPEGKKASTPKHRVEVVCHHQDPTF